MIENFPKLLKTPSFLEWPEEFSGLRAGKGQKSWPENANSA